MQARMNSLLLNCNQETSKSQKKGPWTLQEDTLLINLVKLHGTCNWNQISMNISGRNGKQCRSENSVKNRFHCTIRKLKLKQNDEITQDILVIKSKEYDLRTKNESLNLLKAKEEQLKNEKTNTNEIKDVQNQQINAVSPQKVNINVQNLLLCEKTKNQSQTVNQILDNNENYTEQVVQLVEKQKQGQQNDKKPEKSSNNQQDKNGANEEQKSNQPDQITLKELQRQARNHYINQKRQRTEQTKYAYDLLQKHQSQSQDEFDVYKKLKIESQKQGIQSNEEIEKIRKMNFMSNQEQRKKEFQQNVNNMQVQTNSEYQQLLRQNQSQTMINNMNQTFSNSQIPSDFTENQNYDELMKINNLLQQYQSQIAHQMQRPLPQMPHQVPQSFQNVNQNMISSLGLPNIPQNSEMLTATNQKLLVMIDWVKKVEMMLLQTKYDLEKLEREHLNLS